MKNLREPMDPALKSALIMIASGILASALCAKVYGATLPLDEPTAAPTVSVATSQPASTANDDAEAATTLRAMLMGQRQLLGTPYDAAAAAPPR